MAIDTLAKRSASATFGSAWTAGTRPPTGTTAEFSRGATLGLYYLLLVDAVDVTTERLSIFGTSNTRMTLNGSSQKRLTLLGSSS